jgi:hypothetical protein
MTLLHGSSLVRVNMKNIVNADVTSFMTTNWCIYSYFCVTTVSIFSVEDNCDLKIEAALVPRPQTSLASYIDLSYHLGE